MPSTPKSVTLVIEDGQGNREQHTVDGPGDPIRVAVGRPGRRSAVWNIMANKNKSDIYVAARSVARVQKVSLHESGDWRVQWVDSSEAGRRMAELTGSRIQDQWRRPAETSPGWTKALSIWIPDGEVVDMPNDHQTEEGVIWVPPPAPGLAVGFHVAVARPDNGFTEFPATIPLAGFTLASGEVMMLFVSTMVMTDEIRTMLDNYRSAAKEQARLAGFTRSPDGLRMTMFGRDGDGNRKLWDLAYEPEATGDR